MSEHEGDPGTTADQLRQGFEHEEGGGDESGDGHVRLPREVLKQLRKQARSAKSATERAEVAEEALAFSKAGIDLDSTDPKVRYFVNGYDGEVNPEAIRAAAAEIGLTYLPSDVSPAELQMHGRMADASSGVDGYVEPEPNLVEQIENAPDSDAVMAILQKNRIPNSWDRY